MTKWMLAASAAVLTACAASQSEPSAGAANELVSGVEASHFDPKVRAQDDFYRAVNGQWLTSTPIPADKSNYGAFTKLADDAEEQLEVIVEEAARAQAPAGSEARKLGDLYASFMDTERLEQLGKKPIEARLAELAAITSKSALAGWLGRAKRQDLKTPIGFFVNQDEKNTTEYIGYLWQSGLGLPDRDFYFKDDDKSRDVRAAYVKHIETMFGLAGFADPAGSAKRIYALEEKLAQGHWTRVENRDPQKTYNKLELAELETLSADFDWKAFAEGLGIGTQAAVVVGQPSYLSTFGKTFKETSLEDWKLYLQWRVLSGAAPLLSKAFDDENFAFYSKTLRGVEEQQARWKRGVQLLDGLMGEALGKLYVERHFPPQAKARMEKLVQNLLVAFGQGIDGLEWMTPQTKEAAKAKLAKFTYKIGYPDEWRDYSALTIEAGDLFGNVVRAVEFEYARNLSKLGGPIDRGEWHMTPQTVNAYYNPSMNEIVFPAAILQPPFFNLAADDAVNYGAIGAVIGHEIGHGFDDQGSQYDGDGNLRNWWTDEDREEFEARTGKLVAQYEAFEPLPGERVNGKLTLGENIGDLSGLTIAYRAYELSREGREAPVLEGFTGAQRFFIGWAQVWRRLYREPELRQRLVTDPHSPSEYRCNGVVRNMPEFHAAFDVKPGDALFLEPQERVKIW